MEFFLRAPAGTRKNPKLVVPTSLKMGWIESPPYFCAASETARDVAVQYIEHPLGSLPTHKFEQYSFPRDMGVGDTPSAVRSFGYLLEVYVDDYMSLVIPTSSEQLKHVASVVMHGIHDVFPLEDNEHDPISVKKLRQGEGTYST